MIVGVKYVVEVVYIHLECADLSSFFYDVDLPLACFKSHPCIIPLKHTMLLFKTTLFSCRPMYVRQLARKKIKLETSSSIDTSSSLASSSSSATSLVLTASGSGGGGGGRSSLTSTPAATKKSPARKDGGGRGGPVLTHTPVSSALRLAKGMGEWLCSLHLHTMGDCTYDVHVHVPEFLKN